MPMRVGEMLVIVRAQDFASRTLRRVSGEFAGMSRAQALAARQTQLSLRQMQQADRIRASMGRGRELRNLQALIEGQERLRRMQSVPVLFGAGAQNLQATQRAVQQLTDNLKTASPAAQRLARSLQGLNFAQQSQLMSAALAGNTRQLKQLGMQARLTRNEMTALQAVIRQLPIENLDRFAHALSGIGRTMQLFGAVGTIAFGLAAKTAADFSTEVSLAATQARDLTLNAAPLAEVMTELEEGVQGANGEVAGILDLMQRYPASSQEMTAATYDIFSSMNLERNGIMDVAKGLGLLETANKIAVASGGTLEDATNAMITVLNNFDPELQHVTQTLDSMFDIVRFGRMRLSDFNTMMNKIAPAAADAGQTLEDVGGAMAALTTLMPSQRMVATGISRLLEALQHPDVRKGLRMFGVETQDAIKGGLRPLHEIMEDIANNKQFGEALQQGTLSAAEFFRTITARARGGGRGIFFTQEGRRAFSEMIHNMDMLRARQGQITINQKEFNRAFQQQLQQPGVQWAIFLNQLKALIIIIGREAIPAFAAFGDTLRRLIQWFQNMNPETRKMIVQLGVFVSVASLISGVLLAVLGSFFAFEAMLRKLTISGAGAAGMLGTLRIVLSRLATIGAIVIILQAMWGGDPTAKDFLLAAAAGAAAGARFGPWGAVLGGIVVPVVLHAQTDKPAVDQAWDSFQKTFREKQGTLKNILQGFSLPSITGVNILDQSELSREEFTKQWKTLENIAKIHSPRIRKLWKEAFGATIHPEVRKLFQEFNKGAEDGTSLTERLNRANKEFVKQLRQGNIAAAKEQAEALRQMYEEFATGEDAVNSHAKAMKEWRKSVSQAAKSAEEEIIGSLRSMYDRFQQENEAAFGELMQGPWLTSETFDLAKEWGIAPRIEDLIMDLKQQNEQFARWRSSLDKLMKGKLPREFVDEIRRIGPEEGQGLVDSIMGAKPGQVNALIQQWKRKNQQIKSATKMDFVDEIERFRKAGVDMGDAIINGFQSASVGKWFDNWIRVTFPDVISSAVAQAVSEWKAANPPPEPPKAPKVPKSVESAAAGGKTTTTTTTDNSQNVQVEINSPGDLGANAAGRLAKERMAAFALAGAIQGALGGKR